MDAKPFVRWVGGKTALLPELLALAPKTFKTYREPFLGGGALFFALQPKIAVLSDANVELIHAYTMVRDCHLALIVMLQDIEAAHSKEYYLSVRKLDPRALDPVARAAWFVYMNKMAFNGLWRVNRLGKFNVAMDPSKKRVADEPTIANAHDALAGVSIAVHDFRVIEAAAVEGDFCYFDCPYVPTSATANFTRYTTDGFTPEDQIDLRDLALRLKRRGVHVLLSNAGVQTVRDLYADGFEIHETAARRNVNCKSEKRGAVPEFIIR